MSGDTVPPPLGDLLLLFRTMQASEVTDLLHALVKDQAERDAFDKMAQHVSSHETFCLLAARAFIHEYARRSHQASRPPTPSELIGPLRSKLDHPESGRYSIVYGSDFDSAEDTEEQCPAARARTS